MKVELEARKEITDEDSSSAKGVQTGQEETRWRALGRGGKGQR